MSEENDINITKIPEIIEIKESTPQKSLSVKKSTILKSGKSLSIFDGIAAGQQEAAIKNFIRGETPKNEIRIRKTRGGKDTNYVNGYHMFWQASLITGFRWSHKKIAEEFYPNKEHPIEIMCDVLVQIWDAEGNIFEHTATGSKEVARYNRNTFTKIDGKYVDLGIDTTDTTYQQEKRQQRHIYEISYHKGDIISLGDDRKSAETDAIKKALSYFGIANDIYGQREKQFSDTTSEEDDDTLSEEQKTELKVTNAYSAFNGWVEKQHIRWSEIFKILGIQSADEIKDWNDAQKKIKEAKGLK